MVRSMTGYGKAQRMIDGHDITVEIKSVNHRFYEYSSRIPRAYGYLDEKMKNFLKSSISRGKVEVSVTCLTTEGQDAQVEINRPLAQGYLTALRELGQELGLRDDITLSGLSRFSDIYQVRKAPEEEEVIWEKVRTVLTEAAERFVAMRAVEGERLKNDILEKLSNIESMVGQVEARSPQTVQEYRDRLTAKMMDILKDSKLDEQRILTEAAIYSEKVAVDEETVRLRSHIHQFEEILASGEAVGRKLDFLVQEVNREVNTIGSKANDVAVARLVVDMKSEIEKIREQIQNIE